MLVLSLSKTQRFLPKRIRESFVCWEHMWCKANCKAIRRTSTQNQGGILQIVGPCWAPSYSQSVLWHLLQSGWSAAWSWSPNLKNLHMKWMLSTCERWLLKFHVASSLSFCKNTESILRYKDHQAVPIGMSTCQSFSTQMPCIALQCFSRFAPFFASAAGLRFWTNPIETPKWESRHSPIWNFPGSRPARVEAEWRDFER